MAVAQMVATMTNRPVLRFSHAEQHTGRRVEEACSVISVLEPVLLGLGTSMQ